MASRSKEAKIKAVYSPPATRRAPVRYRPRRHRWTGQFLTAAGLLIVLLNLLTQFTRARLLPGGHSPFYLILGVVVACSSLWWFGWFDRQDPGWQ
jgi:hypothetical protein